MQAFDAVSLMAVGCTLAAALDGQFRGMWAIMALAMIVTMIFMEDSDE